MNGHLSFRRMHSLAHSVGERSSLMNIEDSSVLRLARIVIDEKPGLKLVWVWFFEA